MNSGDVVQGRYRLEETLGKGGMATVWRAHDLRLERSVALKCLMAPLSEDPTFLVRFFSEAQQVAKLSHPNVIRVLDFGEGDECPYLVMEFVPGGSLADVTGEPMLPERALDLIAGAARGAGASHQAGLVHRDLKPGNIMVGEGDVAKVGDFGIAISEAQERFTATGAAFGSPHYVSPEQAAGRPLGPASDVYSLGVVLYELLTGKKPFEADNATALAIAHVESIPEPPSTHRPDLDPAIESLVMTCLAKDPGKRFTDGNELASAIERTAFDGTAPFVAAATPAETSLVEESEDPDGSAAGRNGRRVAMVSAMAAVFLGLLAFGVFALVGPSDTPQPEKAGASSVESRGSINSKESPAPADGVELVEDDAGAVVPTSSPSPTEPSEDGEESEDDGAETEDRSNDTTDDETEEYDDDEEEVDSEPTAEPTSEPTSEPEPAPTSTP